MKRLYIVVEGATEEGFVKTMLQMSKPRELQ